MRQALPLQGLLQRWRGADADRRRQERVTLLLNLVERFVYDLGLLTAGTAVDLDDYVAATVRTRLRAALQPLRDQGCTIRPEFSEYAQVRIEGNLLDGSATVQSVVEFEDRSWRLDEHGTPLPRRRRRVRLLLVVDAEITTIIDHRVEVE